MRRLLLLVLLVMTAAVPAFAMNPDETLSDPTLEARARTISSEVRCLVCQNQSIDESNADIARDLRLLVRERLTVGDSDEQVLNYLVSRYGEFVLLKPRFSMHTLLLWGTPVMLIAAGVLWLLAVTTRRKKTSVDSVLTLAEETQLADLLKSTPEN